MGDTYSWWEEVMPRRRRRTPRGMVIARRSFDHKMNNLERERVGALRLGMELVVESDRYGNGVTLYLAKGGVLDGNRSVRDVTLYKTTGGRARVRRSRIEWNGDYRWLWV